MDLSETRLLVYHDLHIDNLKRDRSFDLLLKNLSQVWNFLTSFEAGQFSDPVNSPINFRGPGHSTTGIL
jgi:hypothetical protein